MQIGVVDYGASNIFSVLRALSYLGAKAKVISKQEDLKSIDKIILPGQGSMGSCVENLKKRNLFDSLKHSLAEKPYLGICLGLQVLFSVSEESSDSEGMNIFSEKVERFSENENIKIPHMGWNQVIFKEDHFVNRNIPNASNFYFVHSFASKELKKENVLAETIHGELFNSAVIQDNIIGVQFHPEKSGTEGLKFLENFIGWKI
tara:strand:+ start:520 stop:1131 length:612 start_codon:yes stop_codon:yes gene_type:complete